MPWGKQVPECNKVHLIKIDGFDEFMAELHEALGCSLQQEVVEPYSAYTPVNAMGEASPRMQ
jgi:hypothetical protein